MADPEKRLAIHLNDHLAIATAGTELAGRALGSNRGTALGDLLERLAPEYDQDRETLRAVMRAVGASEDPLKRGGAWLGEKLGRLKLNGQLTGYSPLSRLIELDGLVALAIAKRGLWGSLAAAADPRLAEFDFAELRSRAEAQADALEGFRAEVAREALAG